jgi:hypothetical protein
MLNSPRSFEDEGVACTPSTILFRSPQTCESSFTQSVFTPLEVTRDSSNDASTSRRRDSSDSEEDHKRVRLTLGSSSPDPTPTPNPYDPQSASASTNALESPLDQGHQHIPTQSSPAFQTPNADTVTSTNSSLAQPDSDIAPWISNVVADAEQNGESSQGLGTTASLMEEVQRVSPFSAYPQSHLEPRADVLDHNLDGPGMTNLINMSNFGRLRDLVNLRLDQETAIRMKDEEIETLRAMQERLEEQIIRLDLELWNASLDTQSHLRPTSELAALRRSNEDLERRIEIQASRIAELEKDCVKLKADCSSDVRGSRKMQEQDIRNKSPMQRSGIISSSQSRPVIVKLDGPSHASKGTKSQLASRIGKKGPMSRGAGDTKGQGAALAARISARGPDAKAAGSKRHGWLNDSEPESRSIRERARESASRMHTASRTGSRASSDTHPPVGPINQETETSIATPIDLPPSGGSRAIGPESRSPLNWKNDDINLPTSDGVQDRGQAQAQVMGDLDKSALQRKDLWKSLNPAKQTGGKVTEKPREW